MSKCGKNKKVANVVIAECVTDVLIGSGIFIRSGTGEKYKHGVSPRPSSLPGKK